MKVSIVTCTWNSVATLADTISSVQSQQGVDIEHVFVDGGSTDGTLEMISERCPAAKVLRNVSGGISLAMNAGAAAATGQVLAHLHSDDYYFDSHVVASAVDAFNAESELKWLFGRIAVLCDGVLQMPQEPMRPYTYRRYLRGAASVSHPAVFIRADAFQEQGGFDIRLKYAMDIDLWLRIGRDHSPLQLDEVFAVFREHPGSLSTANVLAARAEEWRVRRGRFLQAPFDIAVCGLRHLRRVRRLRRAIASAGV